MIWAYQVISNRTAEQMVPISAAAAVFEDHFMI